jgi:hypothetical protein
MTAWKLPLIVVALVAPIVVGFYLGGPGVGVAVGALAAVALLVVAARQRPRGPIGSAPASEPGRHVLLVVTRAVDEPEEIRRIAAAGRLDRDGGRDGADVLVLAPAKIRFLDRWTSDVEPARHRAQQRLVATVAALAKAGIVAEARVGDEDVVQAVEDQLQTFPATEVILIVGDGEEADAAAAASAELESRLRPEFHRLVVGES